MVSRDGTTLSGKWVPAFQGNIQISNKDLQQKILILWSGGLTRYDTTLSGKWVPMFQGNIQPSKNKDNVSLLNGGNHLTEYNVSYFKTTVVLQQ